MFRVLLLRVRLVSSRKKANLVESVEATMLFTTCIREGGGRFLFQNYKQRVVLFGNGACWYARLVPRYGLIRLDASTISVVRRKRFSRMATVGFTPGRPDVLKFRLLPSTFLNFFRGHVLKLRMMINFIFKKRFKPNILIYSFRVYMKHAVILKK